MRKLGRQSVIAILLPVAVWACGGSSGGSSPVAAPSPTPAALTLRYPLLPPMPETPIDPGNPPSMEKVELGTYLFFDPRLSGSGSTACNNCHVFNTSFQDNLIRPRPDTSRGTDFFLLPRNTESLLNIVYRKEFFRDGRLPDLTRAMTEPWVEDNQQLAPTREAAAERLTQILRGIPGYAELFKRAFDADLVSAAPGEVIDLAGKALAVWVRQVKSSASPFDRYNAGDDSALGDAAKRGAEIFATRGRCLACHNGPNFTDNGFHNLSTSPPDQAGVRADEGRYAVTHLEADRGRFQTPSLRHVSRTSPYFHDGSRPTLLDVLKHLNAGAADDPNHDPLVGRPLGLDDADLLDLIAFLRSLRGESVVLWGPNGPLFTQKEVDALQRDGLPR
jgi:cytochrome c peroxidase